MTRADTHAYELDSATVGQAQPLLKQGEPGKDALQARYWPPVEAFSPTGSRLASIVENEQPLAVAPDFRDNPESHLEATNRLLGEVYAYTLGYRDGTCSDALDLHTEVGILRAKVQLEDELLWAMGGSLRAAPSLADQWAAADYLGGLAARNRAVSHPLFDYLRNDATIDQMRAFLWAETIRNEYVDDEVALLVVGLQGLQKATVVANLWDECGRGKLGNFHTHWLRRLIAAGPGGWDGFREYRATRHPWFAGVTSNVFMMLLSRPALKMSAYGCFLLSESWVDPHFESIIAGMQRLGITDDDTLIYFKAHVTIDPRHSAELIEGVRDQVPALVPGQLDKVVFGAHLAEAAACAAYDRWLALFRGTEAR